MPEVFMDVDLMKALIQSYYSITCSFHQTDKSVLCTLDKSALIEAFGLGGTLLKTFDLEDLNRRFKDHTKSFTKRAMFKNLILSKLKQGDIPKKLIEKMPLD